MYSDKVIEKVLELIDLTIDDVIIKDKAISSGNSEWVVFSDRDADRSVYEFIKESLWSFRPKFISEMTGYDNDEVITLLTENEFEDGKLIEIVEHSCGLDNFVNEAIKADGRGHFLSTYDGQETEIRVNGEYYYVYRVN